MPNINPTILNIDVIIPALNEERSIGKVIGDIPSWVRNIIVVDNGSTDATEEVAVKAEARVVVEEKKGYGSACLKGISVLEHPDIVVFLDADYSDRPQEMESLVLPIVNGEAELVIGSRVKGKREKGALTPQAYFGNWLACHLIYGFWRVRYTDLGPFRAIKYTTLKQLEMQDQDYGWTVEMQIKAAAMKIKSLEIPVSYHRRIGKSKISGTVKGVVLAGYKILYTIFAFAIHRKPKKKQKRIILFSKYPVPGKSKTRMIPLLGAEGAAKLQYEMTTYLIQQFTKFCNKQKISFEVRYNGSSEIEIKKVFGENILYRLQAEGDLGKKMHQAFSESFQEGYTDILITGADCPEVNENTIELAFHHLKNNDMVLGPAKDGGYYLIALRKPFAKIFENITWGTETVLSTTLKKAQENNIKYKLLHELSDIDIPEDLPVWQEIQKNVNNNSYPKISVIIPCLNEEENIAACIESVLCGENIECIVVDGNSKDKTVAIAKKYSSVTTISTKCERSWQLNYGAQHASGDILLFLHADCILPPNFDTRIRKELQKPNVAGGAFQLQIPSLHPLIKKIERNINWRSKNASLPYGDQGLFFYKSIYTKLDGFPNIPILEDFILVTRLRKLGKISIVEDKITTSARKWQNKGIKRTFILNQIIICGYYLNFPQKLLQKLYRGNA